MDRHATEIDGLDVEGILAFGAASFARSALA
jgi:hypothetical protein